LDGGINEVEALRAIFTSVLLAHKRSKNQVSNRRRV